MVTYLLFSAVILLIFGAIVLLFPKAIEELTKATNKVLFTVEDKFPKMRRLIGILFLMLSIYLCYIALYKG